jgi:hypothetical protein
MIGEADQQLLHGLLDQVGQLLFVIQAQNLVVQLQALPLHSS